jgi:hypothetical protein
LYPDRFYRGVPDDLSPPKDWRSMLRRYKGESATILYALPSWGAAVLRPYGRWDQSKNKS